jgi:integrase
MAKTQNGTVLKKSGSWVGRYSRWSLDHSTGQKQRLQKSFTIGRADEMTKAEARRTLRNRIEQELGLRSDSRTTIKGFIEQRWKPLRESSWRKSTKSVNEYLLGIIVERFGNVALEQGDAVAMQLWIDGLAKTRSASAVRHIRIFLKSIFSEAVEQDYILKNPARMLRIPAQLKPVSKPFLTVEQIKKLLGAATGMDYAILLLLVTTGLRPSELFGARWGSFDAQRKTLRIVESVYRGEEREFTKTTDASSRKELRIVYLHDTVVNALQEWRKVPKLWSVRRGLVEGDNGFIFTNSENGNFIYKENWVHRNLNKVICKAFHTGECSENNGTSTKCRGENVPKVNFQTIRRSAASHTQGLGSVKDIQTMLRHTKPDMAQEQYVQPMEQSVRVTVDKLASLFIS